VSVSYAEILLSVVELIDVAKSVCHAALGTKSRFTESIRVLLS